MTQYFVVSNVNLKICCNFSNLSQNVFFLSMIWMWIPLVFQQLSGVLLIECRRMVFTCWVSGTLITQHVQVLCDSSKAILNMTKCDLNLARAFQRISGMPWLIDMKIHLSLVCSQTCGERGYVVRADEYKN